MKIHLWSTKSNKNLGKSKICVVGKGIFPCIKDQTFEQFLIFGFPKCSKSLETTVNFIFVSLFFSDLISSITGGSAEIQDIQPYPFDGSSNIDR